MGAPNFHLNRCDIFINFRNNNNKANIKNSTKLENIFPIIIQKCRHTKYNNARSFVWNTDGWFTIHFSLLSRSTLSRIYYKTTHQNKRIVQSNALLYVIGLHTMVCLDIQPYQKYYTNISHHHHHPILTLPHHATVLIFLLFTHSLSPLSSTSIMFCMEKELPSSFHVFICVCLAVLYYCASI